MKRNYIAPAATSLVFCPESPFTTVSKVSISSETYSDTSEIRSNEQEFASESFWDEMDE